MNEWDSEYGGPFVCPVCGRVGASAEWRINARHGHRECPDCRAEGLGAVIPRQCSPEDRAAFWAARGIVMEDHQ